MQRKPDRNEQLGQFFNANTGKLERVVARNIHNARRELIKDACANGPTAVSRGCSGARVTTRTGRRTAACLRSTPA
jgi:hypothetical protein